jgi:hypothetical protein
MRRFERDAAEPPDNVFPVRALFLLFCLVVFMSARLAAAEEVEVASVKFAAVRAPNSAGGPWLETTVALEARPAAGAPGRMTGRVRVLLTLGFELPGAAGGGRRTEYYAAEAECVALEAGRTEVRFYLPPELVKRDQLHGDPKAWSVEVTVGGRPQAPARSSASAALSEQPDARREFLARAGAGAAGNAGLLVPQYLTPFAGEYSRTTPSFVRREGR